MSWYEQVEASAYQTDNQIRIKLFAPINTESIPTTSFAFISKHEALDLIKEIEESIRVLADHKKTAILKQIDEIEGEILKYKENLKDLEDKKSMLNSEYYHLK